MSYILEALKKAQAERQIGNTPTIHAPTLASMPAGQGVRSKRTPVIVAMVLMATAIAGLAMMLLRQPQAASQPSPASGTAQIAPGQSAAAQGGAAPVAIPPAAPGQVAGAAPAGPGQAAPGPATVATRADVGQHAAANPAAPAATERATAQPREAAPPRRTDAVAGNPPAAQPAPVPAPAPIEEQVQSMRDLPEPIQRAIPQITLGGYMYSKNPADRLLLIDKVLRREGEEVAPGLILEKLQPKQAIFGFRGYRYRVAL